MQSCPFERSRRHLSKLSRCSLATRPSRYPTGLPRTASPRRIGAIPSGRALVLRTEPRRAGSRPFRASIPIVGAPPASSRFTGRIIAPSPQGRTSELRRGPQAARASRLASARGPSVAPSASTQFRRSRTPGIRAVPACPVEGPTDGARPRCAGTPGFGPVTGPCRPARRSRGAADRRPRRAPPETPCP